MSIDDLEDADHAERDFFQRARQDSLNTGDRFVPVAAASSWAVVDAQMERVIESGLTFTVALSKAEELSKLDKIQQLESRTK